jgi:hypothetical protein
LAEKSAELVNAAAHFAQAGLPFPFIPQELQSGFHQFGEWLYGTRADVDDLTDMGWFATEVATQAVVDYVMVGRAGRGMQSTALCYYLVSAPLAVFIQSGWGGVYTDQEADVARIDRRFAFAQRLYQAAHDARARGRMGQDERLVVLDSDFSGGSWIRIRGLMDGTVFVRSPDWHMEEDALEKALAFLKS